MTHIIARSNTWSLVVLSVEKGRLLTVRAWIDFVAACFVEKSLVRCNHISTKAAPELKRTYFAFIIPGHFSPRFRRPNARHNQQQRARDEGLLLATGVNGIVSH